MGILIKICGVTTAAQADACAALGADLIGLNFVPASPRCIDPADARAIGDAARGRVEIVGVVADRSERELRQLRDEARLDRLQLSGDEPPELLVALAPFAFKAVRVGGAQDVAQADRYPGLLLLDASVPGKLGGTGAMVDPDLVAPLARLREVILAGGLTPANVASRIEAVRPFGVDVASGVERAPGDKDLEKVAAFIREARRASPLANEPFATGERRGKRL
jgi:phosphoribosylanthranilate isomerase